MRRSPSERKAMTLETFLGRKRLEYDPPMRGQPITSDDYLDTIIEA